MTKTSDDFVLLQEVLRDEPWRMLVGCILLNRTQRAQADAVWPELFRRWPTPAELRDAGDDLEALLTPLGFRNRRAAALRRFAEGWLRFDPEGGDVRELYGCGQYAADAWAIFQHGDLGIEPDDEKLAWYVARRRDA